MFAVFVMPPSMWRIDSLDAWGHFRLDADFCSWDWLARVPEWFDAGYASPVGSASEMVRSPMVLFYWFA